MVLFGCETTKTGVFSPFLLIITIIKKRKDWCSCSSIAMGLKYLLFFLLINHYHSPKIKKIKERKKGEEEEKEERKTGALVLPLL